jgi:hypothetical protein
MPDEVRTPDQIRAAMSAQITSEFNTLIDQGAITGIPKIPVAGAPAPVVSAPAAASPAAVAPVVAAPVAPAPGPTPAASASSGFEGLVEENGLILGKYRTVEELRKGVFHTVNALSKTADELSALRTQTAAAPQPTTVQADTPGGSPRINPVARNPIDFSTDPVLKQFAEESSVPTDLLIQAIDRVATARAEQISAEVVNAKIDPLQRMTEAETYMRTKYPDSVNHINEVSNFLKTNVDEAVIVAELVQMGKPAKAMEYAFKQYAAQVGLDLTKKMEANAAVAEEERLAARAQAGLPTSPNTGVMAARPSTEAPTREEIQALNEAAGPGLSQDYAAVIRRRRLLGSQLPESLRTWEQR